MEAMDAKKTEIPLYLDCDTWTEEEVFDFMEKHFTEEVAVKFKEQKIKGSLLKFMAANASVQQLMACGLNDIGSQLEFQRLIKDITQQSKGGTDDKATEISSSSDSGSIRSVKTVKPNRNALKTMSDLDRKIYKAKRRNVQERAVQKWPGNDIPIFRKNMKALKQLNELVDELALTCTYTPAGFNKGGIRQHILDTLNERRRRIHNGHDYEKGDGRHKKQPKGEEKQEESPTEDNAELIKRNEVQDKEEQNNSSIEDSSETTKDHAPLTKGLLVLTGTASFINILFASSTKHFLPNNPWIQIAHNSKLWHVLSSTLYYSSARNLICGSFLLYSFRIFERRFGSKRYASYIFSTAVIAIGLQLTTISVLKHFGHEVGLPPPGLFGMLYATLVKYFCDIPPSDAVTFLGLPVSGKIFIYSIALQMLLSSKESLLAGTCGMVAGIIYRFNFFQVQHWLKLPDSLTSAVSRTVGNMFISDNPPAQPYAMGATLEIQRLQQIEHYEQQAMRARMGNLRNRGPPRVGQGYADVLVPPAGGGWLWGGAADNNPLQPPLNDWQNGHPDIDNANIPQQPTVEVSEEQVQTLVEMGFSRLAVLHALTTSNNDITVATNILLSQS